MATLEDAMRCPRCGFAGKLKRKMTTAEMKRGDTLHEYMCMNTRCSWFETLWNVLVHADGTVPEPENFAKQPKVMVRQPDNYDLKARIEAAKEEARRALDASNKGMELG